MVNKDGWLITYLKISGYVNFGLSILVSFVIYKWVKNLFFNAVIRFSPHTAISKFLHSYSFFAELLRSATKYSVIIGVWITSFLLIANLSQLFLLKVSYKPLHVLYPCSDSLVMTDEMKQEATKFWKKEFFEDFDCDEMYETRSREW
jgi:hypothetical protein